MFLLKRVFILTLFCCVTSVSYGQFKLKLSLRPSLPTSSMAIPGFTNSDVDSEEVVIATLGAGLTYSISAQYAFSEHFEIFLDAGFFKGFKGEINQVQPTTPVSFTNTAFKPSSILLSPGVILNIPGNFYTKFGPVFGIGTQVEVETTVRGFDGSNISFYDDKTTFGLQSAIGMDIPFKESFNFFVELGAYHLVYKPGVFRNTENFGGPLASDVVFVNEVRSTDDPATVQLTNSLPFHNLGINFGISFSL